MSNIAKIVPRVLTRAPRVLIFGAPGTGKGTYSKGLERAYGLESVSIGDLVRAEIRNETQLGDVFKGYSFSGELVPDAFILDLVFKKMDKMKDNGFILDGFPRSIPQAQKFDEMYGENYIDMVFALNLPKEVLIQTNTGRRVCKDCGKSYNVADIHYEDIDMPAFLPQPDHCNKCEGQPNLFTRDDDKEEIVRNRLDVYERETSAVYGYFSKKDDVVVSFIPRQGQKDVPKALDIIDEKLKNKGLLVEWLIIN